MLVFDDVWRSVAEHEMEIAGSIFDDPAVEGLEERRWDWSTRGARAAPPPA
jgi:hypothetical protein